MGYLTPKLNAGMTLDAKTDLRSGFDRFKLESIAANEPLLDRVTQLAAKKNATPAQFALAWLLAQKSFIVPIPGTSKPDHLHENIGAIDIHLTAEDLREIDQALSEISVHGGRMNGEQMRVVDRTA